MYPELNDTSNVMDHLRAVGEGIMAMSWINVEPQPAPFVVSMIEAAEFYSNRVIKEFKDKSVLLPARTVGCLRDPRAAELMAARFPAGFCTGTSGRWYGLARGLRSSGPWLRMSSSTTQRAWPGARKCAA